MCFKNNNTSGLSSFILGIQGWFNGRNRFRDEKPDDNLNQQRISIIKFSKRQNCGINKKLHGRISMWARNKKKLEN